MKFETVQKAALRLGVTVRAVQKWAKEGKIPYAHKVGRDWMIPEDATRPDDIENKKIYNEPFPILHNYELGNILGYIESIADEDDRNAALYEYYYFTGEFEKSALLIEPYLDSKNPVLRSGAAMFYIFDNLCLGHLNKSFYASSILKEEIEKSFSSEDLLELRAVNVLSVLIVKTQLQLSVGTIKSMKDHIKYLDPAVSLFACFIMALETYLEKDYSKALGITETALSLADSRCIIPLIYLHIIEAVCYINLLKTEEAVQSIEKAWALAAPDKLVMPFVENYNLLQGLVEKHFKKKHPKDYNKIISISKKFNSAWFEAYNQVNERSVAANLTNTEFTIAMLYSRNWRAKEIAAHMELSERTIMNYITLIYDKLHINGKKELAEFLLK